MINAWYPHYPGDYGRDTADLTLTQHGAYRLLLDHYYSTGMPLPPDLPKLYRICRAFDEEERKAVDLVVSKFFQLEADGYHNSRADRELVKRAEMRERLSASGKRGAKKRWGDGEANSHPNVGANGRALASPQP
jgi:uncharacterized protein YdaU (DUF1376 family)